MVRVSFNLESAKTFLQDQQRYARDLSDELSDLQSRWSNLREVWRDRKFGEFEPDFQKLLYDYQDIQDKCELHIARLQRQIDIAEKLQTLETLEDAAFLKALAPLISPALVLAEVGSDAKIIAELTDLNVIDFAALPLNKMMGDQGELAVLKLLLEELQTEGSLSDAHLWIKQLPGSASKPDFFVQSRNLICDAKAWSATSVRSFLKGLEEMAEKYARELPAGGEVRIYVPRDAYEENQDLLKELRVPSCPKVKVKAVPMRESYAELERKRKLYTDYLLGIVSRA